MRTLACLVLIAGGASAQIRPDGLESEPRNLDFFAGNPGNTPPGWVIGPDGTNRASAENVHGPDCIVGGRCAVVKSSAELCFLYQVVDAKPCRGQRIAFRAAVRAGLKRGSVARLLVRIHRMDGSTSFRDDMGQNPITRDTWAYYEIDAPVIADARDVEFGMQVLGEGSAWIDSVSLLSFGAEHASDVAGIFDLIRRFSNARNGHDGLSVAALYSETGEYFDPSGQNTVRGRVDLAKLWGGLRGSPVERTIESIAFPSEAIATIRVLRDDPDVAYPLHDAIVLAREQGLWRIRIHHTF